MDVIRQAYKQYEALEDQANSKQTEESEEEEEFKNRSRDVGHNIYILAHQVLGWEEGRKRGKLGCWVGGSILLHPILSFFFFFFFFFSFFFFFFLFFSLSPLFLLSFSFLPPYFVLASSSTTSSFPVPHHHHLSNTAAFEAQQRISGNASPIRHPILLSSTSFRCRLYFHGNQQLLSNHPPLHHPPRPVYRCG